MTEVGARGVRERGAGVVMALEVVWGLGAANGVGYGPQIEFWATESWGAGLGVLDGGWRWRVEIPAASAGMTEVGAGCEGEVRGCGDGVGGGLGLGCCERGWVWAPNQVWGDGILGRGVGRWRGADSRSEAGMTGEGARE